MSCSPPIIQEAYAINLLGHALWLGILLTWDVSRPPTSLLSKHETEKGRWRKQRQLFQRHKKGLVPELLLASCLQSQLTVLPSKVEIALSGGDRLI